MIASALTPAGLVNLSGAWHSWGPHTDTAWPSVIAPHPDPVTELRYPKDALLVVGGVPAIGKSTLIARAVDPDVLVLVPDDIRRRLQEQDHADRGLPAPGPSDYDGQHWPQAFEILMGKLDTALRQGRPVVLHASALDRHQHLRFARAAAQYGRPAHLLLLDATCELTEAGLAARERQIDAEQMRDYHARWTVLKRKLLAEDPDADAPPDSFRTKRPDRYGHGITLVNARGYTSATVIDREHVNALERITFER